MNLSKLLIVKHREAWPAAVHGVAKSRTQLSNWVTTNGFKWSQNHQTVAERPQGKKPVAAKQPHLGIVHLRAFWWCVSAGHWVPVHWPLPLRALTYTKVGSGVFPSSPSPSHFTETWLTYNIVLPYSRQHNDLLWKDHGKKSREQTSPHIVTYISFLWWELFKYTLLATFSYRIHCC